MMSEKKTIISLENLAKSIATSVGQHEIRMEIRSIAEQVLHYPGVMVNQAPMPNFTLKERFLDLYYQVGKRFLSQEIINYGMNEAIRLGERPVEYAF
jgi:hypothetical protein